MAEECLVCKEPLVYLEAAESMECALCGKREPSSARCVNGHYVCSACHMQGLDAAIGACLAATSTNPRVMLEQLMRLPACHMHGPEHHVLVGAALLTAHANASANAGDKGALEAGLKEIFRRGSQVPGGACGYWGCCGAAVSAGIFAAVVTGSTPLAGPQKALATRLTARVLTRLADIGGPRCCKRGSYVAMVEGAMFAREHLGSGMDVPSIVCAHSSKNAQCLGPSCPFFPGKAAQAGGCQLRALHGAGS